ncbi:ABC transporter substrate-binding protein [Brenneria corticis]|uniref:Nitrate ABC transporter substrate-binding protein n=1 Tax=Brenneria corticis TaxID=2173106 RepID=A0A2U1U155_9GAMM|nr:ABC transporter substrate-binding protein [Brenneria sp. CFCC 11842]PWC15385.1 nitrate ABC transporter substrate-binding protein [Brenneria sp. CFCC 11842]
MMTLGRKTLFTGLLAISILWSGTAAAISEIRIAAPDIGAGTQPSGGGLIDVIYSQKLLEREFGKDGISIRWTFIKGAGPVINEAFGNHQVDVAYLGDLASIIGRSRGLDTRVIAVAARGINHYLGVAKGSGIHQLADLKGKRVGLFRGTAAELSFVNALDSQGVKASDLKIINLDFAAASAALAAGQIDATWGGSNILSLRDKGLAEIPLSSRDLQGAGQLSGFLLVDKKFAQGNEDILRRLVKVQREAAAWGSAEKNKDAFIQLLATQSGYPENILRAEWDTLPPLSERLSPEWDAAYVAKLKQAVKLAYEVRLIRQPFDVDQWLDDSYLKAIR